VTIKEFIQCKADQRKITMLTAYDVLTAEVLDQAGVDVILVGDSVAHVVLGYESTNQVTHTEMMHHLKAVRRGVNSALLIVDMPYHTYQIDQTDAVSFARDFINDGGADAVKVEWFDGCPDVVEQLHAVGIPVMGHIGLTPQRVVELGGYRVQGRDPESARALREQARVLADAGCFGMVLECVPYPLAQTITRSLSVPTIGIGAGPYCDGQVLVTQDLLGLFTRHQPKFVKRYAQCRDLMRDAVSAYVQEVRDQAFPDIQQHSYPMPQSSPESS
jgi:3-methyl-2-oxobutanoate hydroxymethyltransferase